LTSIHSVHQIGIPAFMGWEPNIISGTIYQATVTRQMDAII